MPKSALRLLRCVAVCLGLLVAVLAPAGTANADPTWTLRPGGPFRATAAQVLFNDDTTTLRVTCAGTQTLTGVFLGGTGLPGNSLGSVNTWVDVSCTGVGIPFVFQPTGSPWRFNALSFNSSTGVTTGTLTGVQINSVGQCRGLLADATGQPATLNVTFADSTRTLTVNGGNLRLNHASGCPGYWNTGDVITYRAVYSMTPSNMALTSP